MTTTTHTTNGSLAVVGLGPGSAEGMTIRARETLLDCTHIVGYTTYTELLPDEIREAATTVHATPMGTEVDRTETAIDWARDGRSVALVGSGDPNVYALAGLTLEILHSQEISPSAVDLTVVPGVSAAQFCSARLGAPLVTDHVSLSLSDYLVSLDTIESRLAAVAPEGFVIVLYNPWSRRRTENFHRACEILLNHRAAETPVGIVQSAGRPEETVEITDLGSLPDYGQTDLVDMTTTILIGSERTEVHDGRMVTPRGYEQKYDY